MPTRTNRSTGEVQEMQPDGSWKTIVPAQSGPTTIQTRPPSLLLPSQVAKAKNEATASNYAPQIAQSDASIKSAEAANALAVAQANRDKAIADAKAAQINASGGNKLTPQVRAEALSGYRFSKQLQDTADGLLAQFNAGPGQTKGLEGLKDYLPLTANQQFDNAANKSRGIVGQTLGFTGGQLNTPREAEQAIGPYLPQSADRDSVATDKIKSLQDLAANGRAKAIQILGGEPDENGNIVPIGQQFLKDTGNPQFDPLKIAGDAKTRSEVDPTLKAIGAKVGGMLVNGTPDGKVIKFLRDSGVPAASTNIMDALRARKGPEFRRWMRANPGQPYPIGPEFYTREIPMSAARRVFNKTAQNDIVGSAYAGLASSANAITGDRLGSAVGAVSGDPGAAQAGMELLRTQHPVSSFAGDLAGQASLEAAAGLIPGAQGLMATRYGRRGLDAAYGAYSGSGDNAEDAGAGGVMGGLLGMGTGMAGRGAQKAIGNTLTGVRDASLGYLNKAGIPLTVGQIARGVGDIGETGSSNIADEVGKGVGGIEERLMGLPGLDAIIGTARQRGDVAFNRAAGRQIAPGVTGTGIDMLSSAKAAETAAYGKLNPVRMSVDPQFEAGLNGVVPSNLPHHAGDVDGVIRDIRDQVDNGTMTGAGYQTALRAVRKTRATLNDDVGGKAADALTGLENHLLGLGNRQGGQVAQDLADANAIHARREVAKAAIKSPSAQAAGGMFSPKTLNQVSIRNTEKYGGLDRALSPERPFFDLTTHGMAVMPNLTPDSGTAGRLKLYGALAAGGSGLGAAIGGMTGDNPQSDATEGGGIGLGGGIALGSLLSAPYSKAGQKIIQRALLGERSKDTVKLGEFLIHNPRLAGLLSQAIGRDYFQQPELPQ